MSWNSYSEYLEEWERFEASKDLYNELRLLVIRINYNKRLLSSKTWTPSRKDIIIHKERFEEYLEIFNEIDYKLKLKAYSKRRFDPFCRWDRITIPYKGDNSIQTTIGQLNFFKWALENDVIKYIELLKQNPN